MNYNAGKNSERPKRHKYMQIYVWKVSKLKTSLKDAEQVGVFRWLGEQFCFRLEFASPFNLDLLVLMSNIIKEEESL